MALPETITVNGVSYKTAELAEPAREQVINIIAAEAEISRLQSQLAFVQTARGTYVGALSDALKAAPGKPVRKAPAKATKAPATRARKSTTH